MSKEKEFQLPKKSYAAEFFVGLFAIVGLLSFSYLAVNLAGLRFGNSGYYNITALFDNVSGLELGAPVEIAGVSVGSVKDITLNDTSASVTLEIKKEIEVRDDDIAAVRTKGIIGDKFIKIIPGGSEDLLENGSELSDTESVVDFEEILGKFIHRME